MQVGPAVAAVVVTAGMSGRAGLVDLGRRIVRVRVGWFWYAVLAGTAGVGAGALLVQGVLGQGWPSAAELSRYSGAGVMPWLGLVALVLVVGYFILRLVSPSDAEKVRDKLNGYCNKSD